MLLMSNGAMKRLSTGPVDFHHATHMTQGAGGRCRIRTRVVGFEARQDIQATLIARIPPQLAPLLE